MPDSGTARLITSKRSTTGHDHAAGNKLLHLTAQRLLTGLRGGDIVTGERLECRRALKTGQSAQEVDAVDREIAAPPTEIETNITWTIPNS